MQAAAVARLKATGSGYHSFSQDILKPVPMPSSNQEHTGSLRQIPTDEEDEWLDKMVWKLSNGDAFQLLPSYTVALDLHERVKSVIKMALLLPQGDKMVWPEWVLPSECSSLNWAVDDIKTVPGMVDTVLGRLEHFSATRLLSLGGLETRPEAFLLETQPRRATLLWADIRDAGSLQKSANQLPDRPSPARIFSMDIPTGRDNHLPPKGSSNVLPCDVPWDERAFKPADVRQAIDAASSVGLLAKDHCLALWVPSALHGSFSEALREWNYSPPQVVTWYKLDDIR